MIDELECYFENLYGGFDTASPSAQDMIVAGVAFFVLREDGHAAGCGGIKLVGTEYGELKRIYVRPAYRSKGYGRRIVEHLARYAQKHGVGTLRLETGIGQVEAIAMYERMGFKRIPPFGDYEGDEMDVFFERTVDDVGK